MRVDRSGGFHVFRKGWWLFALNDMAEWSKEQHQIGEEALSALATFVPQILLYVWRQRRSRLACPHPVWAVPSCPVAKSYLLVDWRQVGSDTSPFGCSSPSPSPADAPAVVLLRAPSRGVFLIAVGMGWWGRPREPSYYTSPSSRCSPQSNSREL